jgi:hypothetical protein
MKSFKNIVLLAVFALAGIAIKDGRDSMPAAPSFTNVSYESHVGAVQQTFFGTALAMSAWDVQDYYLFKVARLRHSKDVWLATTIFSKGKWHR